jgi:NAD(P)-dependent dehydrogenase (short-subunit alcohol dehydrogenase family)
VWPAVITGGNSEIDLATAKWFVEEGAYVFITARRQAELDKAVSVIGKNVTPIAGDLSRLEDIDRIQRRSRQRSIESLTPAHFEKIFNLNVIFRKYQKGKLENG